jgi:hypothetical protein
MSTFDRVFRYFMAPSVPWFYRVLLLITVALFVGGAYIDTSVLATIQDTQSQHYARLARLADFFYDFAKVSFGTLIGGLSALVAQREERKEPAKSATLDGEE